MSSWEFLMLGQVATLLNGRAYKKHEMLVEGPYPLLRVGNFFTNREWYYSDLELDDNKYCDHGDLLYAWSASFGPRIWDGRKVIYHYHIWKIEIDSERVDKKYLFHLLEWDKERIKSEQGAGATMVHVTKGAMENRVLPFPQVAEQKRIVAILDQAFAAIEQARAKTEQNLKNVRELLESYLQQVFSQRGEEWVERPIEEVVDSVSTGPFGSMLHKSDYVDDGIPLVNPINIVGDKIVANEAKSISNEKAASLSSYILSQGDLVIARRGDIGRCAVVSQQQEGWVCGTGSFYIRPSGTLNSNYLGHVLRSPEYRSALERVSTGATMKNLSNTSLKKFVVPLSLNYECQLDIVKSIEEVSKELSGVEAIYSKKLAALDELKKSLLQKAFTGQLTQAPQGEAA